MNRYFRHPRNAWLALGLLALVALEVLNLFLVADATTRAHVSDVLQVAAGAFAAVSVGAATRMLRRDGRREAAGWALLATGAIVFVLSQSVYWLVEMSGAGAHYPNPSDALHIGAYLVLMAGVSRLSDGEMTRVERRNALLDTAIMVLLSGVAVWEYDLRSVLAAMAANGDAAAYVSVAYIACNLTLLNMLYYRLVVNVGRGAMLVPRVLMVAAGLSLTVSDLAFGRIAIAGRFVSGSPIDLGWVFSGLFGGLAGLVVLDRGTTAANEPSRVSLATWSTGLSYLCIVGGMTLLAVGVRTQEVLDYSLLAWVAAGTLVLVGIRQAVHVRQSARLADGLEQAGATLELKVHKRTAELAAAGVLLRESEALLTNAFNNSPLLMSITDVATGKFLEVNDTFCVVSGFSRQEVLGRTSIELGWLGVDERVRLLNTLDANGRVEALELAMHAKGGRPVACRYWGEVIHTAFGDKLFSTSEDITQTQVATAELAHGRHVLEQVQQLAQIGSWHLDLDRQTITASAQAHRVYGLEGEEMTLASVQGVVFPAYRPLLDAALAALIADGSAYNVEIKIRRPADGAVRDVHSVAEYDPATRVVSGYIQDVTALKRSEEALRASDQRAQRQRAAVAELVLPDATPDDGLGHAMQAIVESMAKVVQVARASVWLLSGDGSVLECEALYEFATRTHSRGTTLRAVDYPRYFAAISTESRLAADNAQHDVRTAEFTDGYLAPLGITSMLDAAITLNGRLAGVVCLEHVGPPRTWFSDEEAFAGLVASLVSQLMASRSRREAEALLRESETSYRALFEQAGDYILVLDASGDGPPVIHDVNQAAVRVLGYAREELIGQPVSLIEPAIPPGATADRARQLREQGWANFEVRHQSKDGATFDAEVRVTELTMHGKRLAISMERDITDRKRAESERARLEGELLQAQKMESVGRLAGGVAHDFNNMLGVILGHAELALGCVDPSESLHEDLTQIHNAAKRSADLTRQLLAFARKQTVVPRVLDLNDTVSGMLKMLRRIIGEEIALAWRPGEALWAVRMDPSQLDQVLANLCVNAKDAIAGVGSITIESGNRVLGEDFASAHPGAVPGEYAALIITDDGCGMDREMLARIFEPFFTTKDVGQGTGLGLSSVYGAMKQNHGFVDVASQPGNGTTFTLYLPRHAAGAVAEQAPAVTGPVVSGRETILLVEDEPGVLHLTSRLLEQMGYVVLAAAMPQEALRRARDYEGTIDLLVTDVVMPQMQGNELATRVQALRPAVAVLFMSGYAMDAVGFEGALDEELNFLAKPFGERDLGAKVRAVLDRARRTGTTA